MKQTQIRENEMQYADQGVRTDEVEVKKGEAIYSFEIKTNEEYIDGYVNRGHRVEYTRRHIGSGRTKTDTLYVENFHDGVVAAIAHSFNRKSLPNGTFSIGDKVYI